MDLAAVLEAEAHSRVAVRSDQYNAIHHLRS